ncbi:hypothetical protein DFR59_10536 [Falsibacillus pallidus]|uniref:Uncharacterized protein n=1 Tax=Falsibacillus pallidus TaxID=493781 RepID=A0A370GEU1_9BACI|nr:hypothetical protein DFR59_10536 [Falsibacillus pallidus]
MKIVFGEPTFAALQKAEKGEIRLGGCCILEDGPEYYCKDCENEWNKEQAVDAAYTRIEGIKATIGGFFDGHYIVEINLISRQVVWSFYGRGEDETIQKSIGPDTAKKLIEDLKMINLLNWKAKYIEPGILDGTNWSVEISRDGRKISKHGNIKFPDEWDAFCKIIRGITGKKFS